LEKKWLCNEFFNMSWLWHQEAGDIRFGFDQIKSLSGITFCINIYKQNIFKVVHPAAIHIYLNE